MANPIRELFEAGRTITWAQFDPRFAPIFLAYGLLAGLIGQTGMSENGLLVGLSSGMIGSLAGGYLLPGRNSDVFGRGPFFAQIANSVAGAIIGVGAAIWLGGN